MAHRNESRAKRLGRRRGRALARGLTHWVIGPVATVLAASFVIFVALALAPGDPVARVVGDRATDAQREATRHQLGLDEPVVVRYFHWLGDALHGDLGTSLISRQDVASLLAPRLLTTLTLVLMSAVIILVIGVALGAVGGVSDRLRPFVNGVTGLGVAIPSFVASTLLIGVFAVQLGWFPTYGSGAGVVDRLWHLTLPAVALSIGWVAYVAQMTAAAVKEEAVREHVETAVGRGLPRSLVLRRHVMRNASIPVLTASGLTVAGLVAGSVVVETAFGIDGVGAMLVKSVSSKDYAPTTAISVLVVMVFVVVTTVIDFVQTRVDPRLREHSP
jgi:peptide/nickel transport system permease protein